MVRIPLLFSVFWAVSCGSNETLTQMSESASELPVDAEGALELKSSAGKHDFASLGGTQIGLDKVMNSFRTYENSIHQNCRGFLAYEDDGKDMVTFSFFTAVHCLEARDPLGRLRDVKFEVSKGFKFENGPDKL
jgi:hypothetical protein